MYPEAETQHSRERKENIKRFFFEIGCFGYRVKIRQDVGFVRDVY